MNLPDLLSVLFSGPVRSRGEQYYLSRSVSVIDSSNRYIEAVVSGEGENLVHLDYADDTIFADCECTFFERGGFCKHIWATVIESENMGALSAAKYARGLKLVARPPQKRSKVEEALDKFTMDMAVEDDDEDEGKGKGKGKGSFWNQNNRLISHPPKPPPIPKWKQALEQVNHSFSLRGSGSSPLLQAGMRQIIYVVEIENSLRERDVFVHIMVREPKKDKSWGRPKLKRFDREEVLSLPSEDDREILTLVGGGNSFQSSGSYFYGYDYIENYFVVPAPLHEKLMPLLCKTGRAFIRKFDYEEPVELRLDEGDPWQLRLIVEPDPQKNGGYILTGGFFREDETLGIDKPAMLIEGGLLFWDNKVAPLNDSNAFGWITVLRNSNKLAIPPEQVLEFQEKIYSMPDSPPIALPASLQMETTSPLPGRHLMLRPKGRTSLKTPPLIGEVHFDYNGTMVPAGEKRVRFVDIKEKRVLIRDFNSEKEAFQELLEAEFRVSSGSSYRNGNGSFQLAASKLTRVVPGLIAKGWHVEAEGKVYRQAGNFNMRVSSGIDWFELKGDVTFGDYSASLAELIRSLRKGKSMIELGDGSFGILPEEWLKKYGVLARLGEVHKDHIQFKKSQILFLDALLAEKESVETDDVFDSLRNSIRTFEGVVPFEPSKGFKGSLRQYQKEGVGWLRFLRDFSFGGCLADDMGLGKTVQVLALLHFLKEEAGWKNPMPSLVVVPRSLLFNWREEAKKFTPSLKVLIHSGADRQKPGNHFNKFDIILVTYGTMLRDILELKDHRFEYIILDEAQAIKNAASQSAKAVRLLRANHRLALSGTPIENHIGELWSLFEFLNPGILGKVSVFKGATTKVDDGSKKALVRALRPFLLRRTKGEVATDLPDKNEQTIYCEMKPEQREFYDELKRYYQVNLLSKVKSNGMGKSKMGILEALLRLRQAACHPGLIDPKRVEGQSTKLDTLYESLKEVMDEGHKVLVFSQFTSLLAIVRKRLDSDGLRYLYLDGRTRDRKEKVDLFQNDNSYPLFLISLKAGGLGLNLTAAGYVFLLDPWWNPAVEAQAIDRTHRIGQTKSVFAYRLICKDTVEEKVLELQQNKRDLAESIMGGDGSLMKELSHDDLEYLLG